MGQFPALDKESIQRVIDMVINSYKNTRDASKSYKEGIRYATKANELKEDRSGESYRYKGNSLGNFFGTTKSSTYNLLKINYGEEYKEYTKFEEVMNSFNKFVDKMDLDTENYIKASEFSVYI